MSQENVKVIERALAAWNRGDVESLVATAGPDVEITSLVSTLRGKGYRGHAGLREWFTDTHEAFAVFEPRFEELREVGDSMVVALGTLRWRGRDSGIEMREPVAWVWTFRNAKLVRGEIFANRDEALKAAGLAG